jgi:hypothetical protein
MVATAHVQCLLGRGPVGLRRPEYFCLRDGRALASPWMSVTLEPQRMLSDALRDACATHCESRLTRSVRAEATRLLRLVETSRG